MASTCMYLSAAMTAHVTLRLVPTAGGSAVISSTLQETGVASHSGETTVLIGLAIQLFFFALFACLTVYIYRADRAKAACVPMQVYLCMWLTMFGISVRNVYRIIEIGIGWAGYLNTHEVMHLQVLHLQSSVPCLPVWTVCKDGCASALSMLMLTRVAAASDVCHVPVCMQLELVHWHITMQTVAQQKIQLDRLLQVFFYCLDALPILLTFLVFIALPYGKYLPDQHVVRGDVEAAHPEQTDKGPDGQPKSQNESANVIASV